jgi:glutamate N-acetyltransferase/amino-acid N-acetyltransferase
VPAAPVIVTRDRARLDAIRAVVANSGNANAATGERGLEDAKAMQERTAHKLGVGRHQVGVASTGVIGVPLPRESVEAGIDSASKQLSAVGGGAFAEAIMTTDQAPKLCTVELGGVTLSAQAKGAGMMEPGFATLLVFVQTDAVLPDIESRLRAAATASFARITVDGQLSTNDSIFFQASGAAGRPLPEGLLETVMLRLALEVLADGEGATRVARIEVREAASHGEAERVARAVANSQLVQTAIFGRDPNWGRIVQAAGMALAGELVDLEAEDVDADEVAGDGEEVDIVVRLGRGEASAHVFCSDLTYDYVKLNAEYTT